MKVTNFQSLPQPFVISEIGGNHEGSYDYACKLLDDAVEAGAHAVKFQAYAPDRIVNRVVSPERHAHFGKFALDPEQYVELARRCASGGVRFMASVWDREYLELLDPYIEIHKVGSGDLTNLPLIRNLVKKGKPLCLATAMATLEEVLEVVRFVDATDPGFRPSGRLCVMHCVALYGDPKDEYANLGAIRTLQSELPPDVVIGYSDHTVGTGALEIAIGLGACVIEKHFTDDPSRSFRDHQISLTKEGLASFLEFCRRRARLLGHGRKQPITDIETPARIREFRRGVYLVRDLQRGEVVSELDVTTLRPNEGIDARFCFDVIGKRMRVARRALEPLAWEDLEVERSS